MSFGDALVEHILPLRRYAQVLTRNPNRSEDLVQDCLVRALRKQHLFEAGTDLRGWLFRLLHNQHVNDVRAAVRYDSYIAAAQEYVTPAACDPTSRVVIGELSEALAKLPAPMRRALIMAAIDGLSGEEIAASERIPIATARTRIHRGRAKLAKQIDRHRDVTRVTN